MTQNWKGSYKAGIFSRWMP